MDQPLVSRSWPFDGIPGMTTAKSFHFYAVDVSPRLIFDPSISRWEKFKCYAKVAWGVDIWIGRRWPLLKIQTLLLVTLVVLT